MSRNYLIDIVSNNLFQSLGNMSFDNPRLLYYWFCSRPKVFPESIPSCFHYRQVWTGGLFSHIDNFRKFNIEKINYLSFIGIGALFFKMCGGEIFKIFVSACMLLKSVRKFLSRCQSSILRRLFFSEYGCSLGLLTTRIIHFFLRNIPK